MDALACPLLQGRWLPRGKDVMPHSLGFAHL